MKALITKKSESKGVQKEHVRNIHTSTGVVPVLVNKGVRKGFVKPVPSISVRPLRSIPGVSVSLKPLDRRSDLEKKIHEFMKEHDIKLYDDEVLVFEPLEVKKVGSAAWDRVFYFINEKGDKDWVSLKHRLKDRPHMYTVKFHIVDAARYGAVPFIILRNADNEIAGIRGLNDDEVVSF